MPQDLSSLACLHVYAAYIHIRHPGQLGQPIGIFLTVRAQDGMPHTVGAQMSAVIP